MTAEIPEIQHFCRGTTTKVSYNIWNNQHFRFPTKFKTVGEIWEIWHFSEAIYLRSQISNWSNISLKLLYPLWFWNEQHFQFPPKFKMADKILEIQHFSQPPVDECVFFFLSFYTEIQDGRRKWRENDFWEKSPVNSEDTVWIKNFIENALSRTVPEINAFLHFTQKFKMTAKIGGKTIFEKSRQ